MWRVVALALIGWAAQAYCACTPSDLPAFPTTPDMQPLIAQYQAMAARDRYLDVTGMIPRWQALADQAARANAAPALQALIETRLAWLLEYAGRIDEALPVARAADRIARENKLQGSYVAEIEGMLALVEVDAGKLADADDTAARASAQIDGAHAESADAAYAHSAHAYIAYARGDYPVAEREYGRSAALAEACLSPDSSHIVSEMASHAGVMYMLGRSEDALAENERAANWALTHLDGSSPVVTLALGNLGVMLRSAGRYAEAEAALRRVVDLEARYQHDSWYYRAIALSNFATVIDREGRSREAETLWTQASEWHARAPNKNDPATRAYPLRYSADSAEARGDLPLALTRRRAALALMEAGTAPDHPELARTRIELATTLMATGQAGAGRKLADAAMPVIRTKLGPDDVKRLTAEIQYARLVAATDGAEAGYALAAPIAARLETRLVDSATGRGDLIRYGPAFSASFAAVTELALRTGRDEAAFHALQLANLSDIALVNAEVAVRAAAKDEVAAAPLRRLQEGVRQRQALDRDRSFAAAAGNAADVERIAAAITANDHAIATAAQALETAFPAYRRLGRPTPVTLAAFRRQLAPSEVLLAPVPTEGGTLAILVTRDGLRWRRTDASRAQVNAWVGRIRGAIDRARQGLPDHRFDTEAARQLFAALVPGPLVPTFTRHPDLLYYSAGPLATLPPALLITGGSHSRPQWLVATHSIRVLPDLAPPPVVARTAANEGFLGIGAPALPAAPPPSATLFRGMGADQTAIAALPPLPHAAGELAHIGRLVGGPGLLLTGAAATEPAVRRLAGRSFAIVAIATHALGGGSFAGLNEPALVLTPGSGGTSNDDGLLTASDAALLRLNADWVILSACDTASGIGAGSPAYSGLASAFMQGGARTLLVSHWPVRDDAAEAITVGTVRGARQGLARPRALQQAMLRLMADRRLPAARDPAIWAPFVLIGK